MFIWFPLLLIFWFYFICAGPNFPFSVIQLSGQINESSDDNNVVRQLRETETRVCRSKTVRVLRLKADGLQIPLCFMPLTEVLVIWKVLPGFWLVRKSIAVVFLQHDSSGVTAHYSDCQPGQSLSFSIVWGWERFMKLFPPFETIPTGPLVYNPNQEANHALTGRSHSVCLGGWGLKTGEQLCRSESVPLEHPPSWARGQHRAAPLGSTVGASEKRP